jgi:large subunit ribosomal protein L23
MSLTQLKMSEILVAPIISEKSTGLTELNKIFAFKVKKVATKKQIQIAVESMFDVKVEMVRILNVKGKTKRFGRVLGSRSNWKKAYVKLEQGYDIDFVRI